MTGDLIRVILADDHRGARGTEGACSASTKDIEVIGEAKNGREAVALVERFKPRRRRDGSRHAADGRHRRATKEIVAKGLPTRVLVLTMHAEEEYLVPLLEAGAAGYLVKSAADRELVDAVRAVAHGDVYVQPVGGARAGEEPDAQGSGSGTSASGSRSSRERERDVLALVAQGYSAPEIGEKLFISPKTVDTYKQRIQEKLGLRIGRTTCSSA